ncbi:MAG: DUF2835 domain-containing protein [Methylococcales bacterium]|nr:DUF2835 domain-containing protein [Methylococcales bacterium]
MAELIIRFAIRISYEQFARVYQGAAKTVQIKAEDGRQVRLPAEKLKPFLTHTGIQGRFELRLDENHKFLAIHKLG